VAVAEVRHGRAVPPRVGSVRGFALYLGVTTVCDVIVLRFFSRPR